MVEVLSTGANGQVRFGSSARKNVGEALGAGRLNPADAGNGINVDLTFGTSVCDPIGYT